MSRQDKQAAELDAKLAALGHKQMKRSSNSAMNKTAALARTRTIRGVAKQVGVQQKQVRKRVYVGKATAKRPVARVLAYAAGISLIHLKPRDTGKGGWRKRTGKGVYARGASGHHFPDAFIATAPNGMKHVFERTLKVSRRKGRKYHHVDVVRVEIDDEVKVILPRVTRRVINARFHQLLQHEIDWRMKKQGVK